MHPIEQLRFVARASGADAGLLVQEAASALGVFAGDPAGLLTAARRLLTRQPAVGPLWWMCSRLAVSPDPYREARAVIEELRSDRTDRELAHGLPDGATVVICGWPDLIVGALPRRGDVQVLVIDVEGQGMSVARRLARSDVLVEDIDPAHIAGAVEEADLVLVEAAAVGSSAALTDVGSVALAATARALGRPTWLVAGVGRHLHEPYWQAIVERTAEPDRPAYLAPFEVLSLGLVDRFVTADGVLLPAELPGPSMPMAPELLRQLR
jgi:hypothetical protein